MANKKILTPEEEIELFNSMLNGDKVARDTLIVSNESLIHEVCKAFKNFASIEYEDLVMEGWMALTKAVDNFDVSKGLKFNTYAVNCIRGAVKNYITEHSTGIHNSSSNVEKMRTIVNARIELTLKLNREPTNRELAEKCNMFTHTLEDFLNNAVSTTSYEANLTEDEDGEFSLANITADTSENVAEDYVRKVELKNLIGKVLSTYLTPIEIKAITSKYLGDKEKSFEDVSKELNLNGRQTAKVIIERALTKLRGTTAMENLLPYLN